MATKKKIKTYGVRNLMEWVCNIPVGKGHMRIEFTGGVLTSYGNTPAKFVTKDLFQQTVIEHSDFFKKKRIILLSVIESDEDEDRLPVKPLAKAAAASGSAQNPSPSEDGNKGDDEGDGDGDSTDPAPETAEPTGEANTATAQEEGHIDGERTADGRLIVEVDSVDDAKNYLNEKFGIAVRNLRSGVSVVTAGTENGIYFKGLEKYYEKAAAETTEE